MSLIAGDRAAIHREIAAIIDRERSRQERGLELIASENFASCAVRAQLEDPHAEEELEPVDLEVKQPRGK